MEHIGQKIRRKRKEKNLSAEYVASQLKNPITKQAFAKKERTGAFSFDLVQEVASIIGCSMSDFLMSKSTKSIQKSVSDPQDAA